MNVALRKPMTQAEFFGWAETQNERYEFDGFQPVGMTGGSRTHARIGGNIFGELRERLRGSACEPFNGDAGIQTIGEAVRYPDCVVSCAPDHDRDRLVSTPVIVFEVVSPTSIREDRILKPDEYALVPSIKRYVIVEQTVIGATVLWRESDEPWRFQTLKAGDTLALPEIGIELPLDSFYERVNFDEPSSE
jgi:Uma2 family endonuclease